MPIGAIIARYLKVSKAADPAWFYLHVACQSSAYIVGVAGWATGLKLGSESPGITYTAHRTIGIVLFCLGTLQVSKESSICTVIFCAHVITYVSSCVSSQKTFLAEQGKNSFDFRVKQMKTCFWYAILEGLHWKWKQNNAIYVWIHP